MCFKNCFKRTVIVKGNPPDVPFHLRDERAKSVSKADSVSRPARWICIRSGPERWSPSRSQIRRSNSRCPMKKVTDRRKGQSAIQSNEFVNLKKLRVFVSPDCGFWSVENSSIWLNKLKRFPKMALK
jgi:hypothetical protein